MAERDAAARKYVDGIRNRAKRAYAERFLRYLRNGVADDVGALAGDVPERGELSYMAAQAVEMNLRAIWRGEES